MFEKNIYFIMSHMDYFWYWYFYYWWMDALFWA